MSEIRETEPIEISEILQRYNFSQKLVHFCDLLQISSGHLFFI
jgi:hypothetical protein